MPGSREPLGQAVSVRLSLDQGNLTPSPIEGREIILRAAKTCLCVGAHPFWSCPSRPSPSRARAPQASSEGAPNPLAAEPSHGPHLSRGGVERDPDRRRRLPRDRARRLHVARRRDRRKGPSGGLCGLLRVDRGADAARRRHLRERFDQRRRGDAAGDRLHVRHRRRDPGRDPRSRGPCGQAARETSQSGLQRGEPRDRRRRRRCRLPRPSSLGPAASGPRAGFRRRLRVLDRERLSADSPDERVPGGRVAPALERELPPFHVPVPCLRPTRGRLRDRLREGRARRPVRLRTASCAPDRLAAAAHREGARLSCRDRAYERRAPALERRPDRPLRVRRGARRAGARQPAARRVRTADAVSPHRSACGHHRRPWDPGRRNAAPLGRTRRRWTADPRRRPATLGAATRRDRAPACDGARVDGARRGSPQDASRDDRRALPIVGGEGQLHRRSHRARLRYCRRARRSVSGSPGRISTRSRSAR